MADLIVRIDLGAYGRLGPGKLLLMQKIAELGSISAAGRALNMSYRQAWSLIDQLNHAFKDPVVASQTGGKSGGGAVLTDFGKLLLIHCNAIVSNAKKTSAPHLQFIDAVLLPPGKALTHQPPALEPEAKPKPSARKSTPARSSGAKAGQN